MKHNYQLHRVIPKLSADIKIDVLIDSSLNTHNNNSYSTTILYTGVSPVYYGTLNSYVDDKDTPGYLEGKFKDLVELYSDKLYGISNQELLISNFTNNNTESLPYFDKYLSGTFRTRYNDFNKKSTHCTLIPLWLSDLKKTSSLQVILKVLNNGNELIRKVINLSENRYINQYLQTRIVGDGENRNKKQGIYIDHINQKCIVYGYSLKESTVVRVESDDLYASIFEISNIQKPHIETMSIIGNWFADNQLILPQLINFGIHFDINALIGGLSDISQEQDYQIETEVIVDGGVLPFKDYYTNFDYIPAYIIGKNKGYFDTLAPNILEKSAKDFNEEISNTPLLYANQLDQRLVHWTHTESPVVGGKNGNPDTIFNTSSSFKNVKLIKSEDGLHSDIFQFLPGNSYGSFTGQTAEKYDPEVHNIQWAGQVMYGSMNKCIEVLNNIDYYIHENSGNFLSLIGNNNKSDIYLGLMTTPSENAVNLDFYGTTPHQPPLKDKRLYKELIPYEFTTNNQGTKPPHGLNDLKPRLYFKLDKLDNDRYREVWLIWAPHVVRPGNTGNLDRQREFDTLGYKECTPDYLTQGKVLNWFRKILSGIKSSDSSNSNNNLSEEQAYYKKWWSKAVGVPGNKSNTYTPGILNELEEYGLLFRLPIGNQPLDYYINFNEVLNGEIKYGLYYPGNNIQYNNYIDRLGGYIIPAFCDPNESIIKITSTTIKYFNKPGLNFQYYIKGNTNNTKPEKYEISKLGQFINTGYGSQQYFPRKNVGITILNTKEVPGFLNNLTEFRWFNQGGSRIVPLPKIIKQFNLSKTETVDYLKQMDNKKWYSTKVYHSDNNTFNIIRELI